MFKCFSVSSAMHVSFTNLGCKLAQRVAFLRTTVKATVVTCRVRNPACTAVKRPWEPGLYKWSKRPWEPVLYKWSKRPWRSRLWRYINKLTYLLTYKCQNLRSPMYWNERYFSSSLMVSKSKLMTASNNGVALSLPSLVVYSSIGFTSSTMILMHWRKPL